MVWYSHLLKNFPQFIEIHTVKDFGKVNKAEIDVFLEPFCFFNDPTDVGNLISVSSAFSKSSLNMWKVSFHVLLKPGLENFVRPGAISQSPGLEAALPGRASPSTSQLLAFAQGKEQTAEFQFSHSVMSDSL